MKWFLFWKAAWKNSWPRVLYKSTRNVGAEKCQVIIIMINIIMAVEVDVLIYFSVTDVSRDWKSLEVLKKVFYIFLLFIDVYYSPFFYFVTLAFTTEFGLFYFS